MDANAANGYVANINWIDVQPNIPVAPTIGSLNDSPDSVIRGGSVALTANVVSLNATAVSFYRESNQTPGLQADDTLISTDSTPNDGFKATVDTTGLPLGPATYYAQATDSLNSLTGVAVSATGTINPIVPIIGAFTANPTSVIVNTGTPITLTAKNVTDTGGNITGVSFYQESNGKTGFQSDDTLDLDRNDARFSRHVHR